ncbi:hypothetical protein [Microbacterium sp. B19]|uniref:hypothetical protein n=1 Tax=Microbacterium sp. B19 TaxID=96765 RepID=UPI00034C89C0|nr:hypothetical protein [Microbacterium sp. B19]
MSSSRSPQRAVSRGDRFGIIAFVVAGVATIIWAVVRSVIGIVHALPNRDIELDAPFVNTMAQAPIGPDGAAVTVSLDTAVIVAPSLPWPSLVALIIAQALFAAIVVTVVALLIALCLGILRGRIFSRRHTTLVSIAGLLTLVGMYGVPFLYNMAVNGALARISDYTYDRSVVGTIDLLPIVAVAFVSAIAGTVFVVGDRLQRDTEGLV